MRKRHTTAGRPRTVDPTGKAAGSRKVAAWVTDAQYEALRRRAAADGVSISELVRQALAS